MKDLKFNTLNASEMKNIKGGAVARCDQKTDVLTSVSSCDRDVVAAACGGITIDTICFPK